MSRDLDSYILPREEEAVKEWLTSSLPFHLMRDHPSHNGYVLAGERGIGEEGREEEGGKGRKREEERREGERGGKERREGGGKRERERGKGRERDE